MHNINTKIFKLMTLPFGHLRLRSDAAPRLSSLTLYFNSWVEDFLFHDKANDGNDRTIRTIKIKGSFKMVLLLLLLISSEKGKRPFFFFFYRSYRCIVTIVKNNITLKTHKRATLEGVTPWH
jgi:hypothetical protein